MKHIALFLFLWVCFLLLGLEFAVVWRGLVIEDMTAGQWIAQLYASMSVAAVITLIVKGIAWIFRGARFAARKPAPWPRAAGGACRHSSHAEPIHLCREGEARWLRS